MDWTNSAGSGRGMRFAEEREEEKLAWLINKETSTETRESPASLW